MEEHKKESVSLFKLLEVEKFFEVNSSLTDSFTMVGVNALERYFLSLKNRIGEVCNRSHLHTNWYSLVTPEGKLPTRISKYAYKTEKLKLPVDVKSQIGNIISTNRIPGRVNYYDFDDQLDWLSGDFGDSHSCMWTDRNAGRLALQANGAKAIRFYAKIASATKPDLKTGIGRAWIYEKEVDGQRYLLMWNVYGLQYEQAQLILLNHFKQHFPDLKIYSADVEIYNNELSTGHIYINRSGFVFSTHRTLPAEIDLEIETLGFSDGSRCECCGEYTNDDELIYVEGTGDVCEYCFDRYYFYCDHCNESYHTDHLETVHVMVRRRNWNGTLTSYMDTQSWCCYCARDNCSLCEGCEEYYQFDDCSEDINGDHWCRSCAESQDLHDCFNCCLLGSKQQLKLTVDKQHICENCIDEEKFVECVKCNLFHQGEECENCIEEKNNESESVETNAALPTAPEQLPQPSGG